MKKYIFTLALFCLYLNSFSSNEVFAQGFNSITTPDGLNLVAVGNSGKLYRSANSGAAWTSTTTGILNMNSATSYGNDVWIAVNGGKVYKTLKTSSAVTVYLVGTANFNSIYFIDSNTGFVCGDGGVIYKTVNGGLNWALSNSGITSSKLNSINFLDANTGTTVGNNGNIFVTSDGGSSWASQSSGTTNNLLKVKYFNNDLVAAGEYGTLLQNTGSGWTSIASRTRTDIRGITGTSMTDVHLCGGGGFIRNNKSGSSNYNNFENNPMMANLTDIFYFDSNKGWAVSSLNSVIIYTTNGGTNWSMPPGATVSYSWVSKPGASGSFLGNNICQHPYVRNTVFVVFNGQVYRSLDRGETYSAVGNTIPATSTPHSFFVSPVDTNIWLVATEASPDKVYRTSNYGQNWTQVLSLNFSSYGQPLEIDQNNPSVFYFAPDNGGFWKSVDNGATFSEISGNFPFRSPCEIIVAWDSSNVIILGDGTTGSGRAVIFKSSNGGVNWTPVDTTTSDGSETPSMCNTVFSKNIFWSTEWGGTDIYKSTDYGSTFSLHHSTGFSGWGSDICREDPSLIITGSWGASATLSLDGGQTWTALSTGLSGHGGGILAAERGFIVAQQGSNVYKLNITYTDNPVLANIDVLPTSLGATGVNYFQTVTIIPTGTVKNNNGAASATFNVTRTITPGGYSSTKIVTNLNASSSTSVNFDPWTFNSGTTYSVKDSVYIADDVNTANDVLSGAITPYVGDYLSLLTQQFSGIFPPTGWTLAGTTGTQYWIYNSASSYGNGTGCSEYNFWNSPAGRNQTMTTSTFTATISGDRLTFDYAYAPFTSGTDSLIIEKSTNGGSSYTNLTKLYGKADYTGDSSLATVPTNGSEFFPASTEWLTKNYILPAGTNRIRFRARSGFGNNLFIDNININSGNLYTQVNLKLAPEGFYNGTTLNMSDTITAYLRNTVSPFAAVDSSKTVLDAVTLTAACVFKNAPSGTYYYQIIHRNSLETWSDAGGESFTKGVTGSFDFTSLQSQSYSGNATLVGTKWCFYSGDVNRDGAIDLADLSGIDNDAYNFVSGYVVTDVNGDGTTDISDAAIADNNAADFVAKITPETSPNDIQILKDKMIQKIEERRIINSENNKIINRKNTVK